ncbi:restriction endonuclease subunit S [Brevibacterium sp. S111]|uniref:restriction endonuclease subunit S n=1 Tax=Brevibacterium sp. S111 TaxID=2483795 RepID=UPI001436C6E5|nr:restriction endonuclease subunit S [Brevibacterium sp. S111]
MKRTTSLITDFDNIPVAALVPEDEQPYEIPAHWKWVRSGKAVSFTGGGTPSKRDPAYWGGEIPWASVKDLGFDTISCTVDRITESGFRNSSAQLAEPGDLIVATRIAPGVSAITEIATTINQDLKIARSEVVLAEFLKVNFDANFQWFSNHASGTTVMGVTLQKLHDYPLPLPPIDEQKAIVEKLRAANQKIDDVLERLDHFLEEFPQKQFTLVQALLAGYGSANYKDDPPKAWKVEPLGKILRVSSGKGLTAREMHPDGGVPVYGGNGVTGYHDQACYPAGTIAIGRVGYYCGAVHMSKEECWVTDNALVARFNEHEIDKDFLYHLLAHTNLRVNTSSSAQPLISGKKIYDIEVQIPPLEVQKSITADIERTVGRLVKVESAVEQTREMLLSTRSVLRQKALRGIS